MWVCGTWNPRQCPACNYVIHNMLNYKPEEQKQDNEAKWKVQKQKHGRIQGALECHVVSQQGTTTAWGNSEINEQCRVPSDFALQVLWAQGNVAGIDIGRAAWMTRVILHLYIYSRSHGLNCNRNTAYGYPTRPWWMQRHNMSHLHVKTVVSTRTCCKFNLRI